MKKDDLILVKVAKSLGVPAVWLWNLIQHESGWNPLARAFYPYNKKAVDAGKEAPKYARGLIQFIDSTAQGLGYTSADALVARNPDSKTQLMFPILSYLKKQMPFPTEQSLYLTVFYPKARNWPLNKSFPDSVTVSNPGIKTPLDYINKVRGRVVMSGLTKIGGVAATIVLLLLLVKK